MININELRQLAQAVSEWSSCNQAWLDQSEDVPAAAVGHIDEDGSTYPIATIDCDQYYAAHQSLPLAKFYAAANPAAVAELLDRLEAAEKERDDLLEALKEIMPFTATAAIGCHGEKCREPWCHSCNGEEEAEAAAQKGCDALAKARAAIARATGDQP